MPAKNVVKQLSSHTYYHIYNRGVARQSIFLGQADKRYFLSLLDRHLNPHSTITDNMKRPYNKFDNSLELLCFCLMSNHFHMLVYLEEDVKSLSEFMRSIGTAYTMYFNLKYKRVGPLFQGTYKAASILEDTYLLHISRYIHLNPREYKTYKYSSLPDYLGITQLPWLHPNKILDLFDGSDYLDFVEDYEEHKQMLDDVKKQLADT